MRGWFRALLFFVACLAAFASLRMLRAQSEEAPTPSQQDLQASHGVPVEVTAAELRPVSRSLTLYGTVQGVEQSEVVATSPNILAKLHVAVGDQVRRGQQLATMRTVSLSPLGYPYEPLEVQHQALQAELERMRPLLEQGAITDQQFDQLQARADAAQAQLDSAKAAVFITAPISGTVTRIDFRPGEMVPNDRPLMQVARIDPVVLELMAEASDVALIRQGMTVQLRSSALSGQLFTGTVVERSLAAYPVLNQFPVRVEVPNPDQRLLPGYPVEASVLAGSGEPTLAVPRRAVVEGDQGAAVWVADADSKARRVSVRPGVHDDVWVAVQAELQPGDAVITLGQQQLQRTGQLVVVVD
jgi:membrane fusion protein, multidrug efflux system